MPAILVQCHLITGWGGAVAGEERVEGAAWEYEGVLG